MPNRDLARALWRFTWRWLPGPTAVEDDTLISSCAELFSSHYGTWGPGGRRPGQPVQINGDHVRQLLDTDDANIVCAFDGDQLAGYAIVLRFDSSDHRRVAWIAQLVVHPTYRKARVATTLLFSAWQFSDYQVWGLVTANPYAVRALETATRRPCRAREITDAGLLILHDLSRFLRYLPVDFDQDGGKSLPSVDTNFQLDLSELNEMKERAARGERPWNLGQISEGHEWFAATFSFQPPSVARGEYLDELLEGVDAIWVRAYEGMTLDQDHAWHRYGPDEMKWAIARSRVEPPARVLDAGCGDARHASALAEWGFVVTAVDISPRLLQRAAQHITPTNDRLRLIEADLRHSVALPPEEFDLILCLYDVIGSSANPADDRAILSNLRGRIASSGKLILSVMNSAATLPLLTPEHCPESEEAFVAALEKLPPSREMERSGGVFHPEYLLYFGSRYYRKEQFDRASDLPPSEVIVRDRRFSVEEIEKLLVECGFRPIDLLGVRAGKWNAPLDPSSRDAKEILVVAEPG